MSVSYHEQPPPVNTRHVAACLWEQQPAEAHVQRVIPDGCVDLIWQAECELVFAGADTGPRMVELAAGMRLTGIRLRPGAAGAVLGLPASELRDRQISAEEVWGERALRLKDSIALATPDRRLELLVNAVAGRDAKPDQLVVAAGRSLGAPAARVAAVADELGVSERTLHRRMVAAVGYGPKMLARVARLRRLVSLGEDTLVTRAYAAGYANQAHMQEEVRRLTGTSAVRFLKDADLTAA